MSKQTKRSYRAPALEKGLDIIEFLSSQVAPQSLTEIAASLGRSHNEIYRMLASLEDRHYVLRDEASSRYHLSLKLFHLSHMHSPVEFLRNAAIVPMRRLTETVRQACHLAILSDDTMMVLIRARSLLRSRCPSKKARAFHWCKRCRAGCCWRLPMTACAKTYWLAMRYFRLRARAHSARCASSCSRFASRGITSPSVKLPTASPISACQLASPAVNCLQL